MGVIAVDFDGTLCTHEFPEIGKVYPQHQKVADHIRELKKEGHTIILWTCREDKPERAYLTEAIEWCKKQNIPIDMANCYVNPGFADEPPIIKARKLFADLYIDDHALNVENLYD